MKISLAKAFAAVTTATALTFAGAGVATAAPADDSFSSSSSSDDGEKTDPEEIREWIRVFTSIISALDTAMSFATR